MDRLLVVVVTLMCLAGAAMAETRALLIGVSDYDDAAGVTDLRGPANDVRLLTDVLRARGVEDITQLADGVEGSAVPTHAAILAALDDLVGRTGEGDFIFIHMSGHGTRQADLNGDETDGLDEVFLPADTARAEPGGLTIPNALVDDEIGSAVARLRAAGADVWLVMDSCHSGSGLRASDPRTAVRYVDAGALGLTLPANPAPEQAVFEAPDDAPGGDYLAFYSARSAELAREVNLAEEGAPEAWYGLFTARLAARLQTAGAISFRQLFQGVLSDMNEGSVPGAARLQTPSWEGTLIDAALFGGAETTGVRRFALDQDALKAGLVHGIPAGTLMGLVADAADAPDAILGFAQTEDVTATQSFLRAVDAGCTPRGDAPCASAGSVPEDARFAQVIARPVDRRTVLALPHDLTGVPLAADHPGAVALRDAIAAINESGTQTLALSDTDYTVDVAWDGSALWFGPQAVIEGAPVGLRWSVGDGGLPQLMIRVARAEQMARMLDAVGQGGSLLSPNPVTVTAQHTAVAASDLAPINEPQSIVRECTRAYSNLTPAATAPLRSRADTKQCDRLDFVVQGTVAGARDVNRVYIDSQYCITAEHERIEDTAAPRRLGPDMTICSDCPSGYSAGQERLFVITTEGVDNAEALNLEGLIENCGPAGGTRSAASTEALDFLGGLAARPDTRGSIGGFGLSNIWVEQFSWRVLPRREAYRRAGRSIDE